MAMISTKTRISMPKNNSMDNEYRLQTEEVAPFQQ